MDVNDNSNHSWEQLPNETPGAHEAFCVYRDMGPTRSLAKVAQAMGHKPSYKQQLGEWSAKDKWVSRCLDYDRYMQKVIQLEKEEAIRQMTNRHARGAIRIQEMVMEALETTSLEAAPPRDLIHIWEKAVRAERTSRGLPAEPIKANYVDYSDAVTDHYLDHESNRKKKEEGAKVDDLIASTWELPPIVSNDDE